MSVSFRGTGAGTGFCLRPLTRGTRRRVSTVASNDVQVRRQSDHEEHKEGVGQGLVGQGHQTGTV